MKANITHSIDSMILSATGNHTNYSHIYKHLSTKSKNVYSLYNSITDETIIVSPHDEEFVVPNVFVRDTPKIETPWIYDIAIPISSIQDSHRQ